MIQNLIFFILGIIFIELIIPVIEALTIVIVTALEVAKGKLNMIISNYNIRIQKMAEELEPENTHAIGFVVQNNEPEEEEEDE
jgi:hypothetical protein